MQARAAGMSLKVSWQYRVNRQRDVRLLFGITDGNEADNCDDRENRNRHEEFDDCESPFSGTGSAKGGGNGIYIETTNVNACQSVTKGEV